MKFDCIITQGHIPEYDPQGGLSADEKLEMFNLSLRHLRQNNPDSYIILTGHGNRQPDFSLCDWHYWEPEAREMSDNGYLYDMPAQFFFVDMGLEQAEKMGFDRCLKTRTDCVMQRTNITHWCEDILEKENKQILLTQQTSPDRIGDCFMYGNTDDMRKIWHRDNSVVHYCGLVNTGTHFSETFARKGGEPWLVYVKRYAAFRDVVQIPFLCLRWNYKPLKSNGELDQVLANTLDIYKYAWGFANKWHKFDVNRTMICGDGSYFYTEQEFYT